MKKNKKYLLIENGHGLSLVNLSEVPVLFDIFQAKEKEIQNFLDHDLGRECWRVYALLEEQEEKVLYSHLFDHQDQSNCSLLKKFFPQLKLKNISSLLRNQYLVVKGPEGFQYLTITGMNIPASFFEKEVELLKFTSRVHFIRKEVFPDQIKSVYAYVDELGKESFIYLLFGHKVEEFNGFIASTQRPSVHFKFID